jgi:hypothetical protein
MVGFATVNFKKDGGNSDSKRGGYYLYIYSGALYSKQGGVSNKSYHVPCYTNGTIIEGILENNTIRYAVNGSVLPVAYENVTGDLLPAFDLYKDQCEFEFV